MTNKIIGKIEEVSETDGKRILIANKWYKAAGKAPEFVKGYLKNKIVEISLVKGSETEFSFLKQVKEEEQTPVTNAESVKDSDYDPVGVAKAATSKEDYWKNRENREIENQKRIHRHGCINSAIKIIEMVASKTTGLSTTDDVLKATEALADKISAYINKNGERK